MDLDLEKYFDEVLGTLRSKGWSEIILDVKPKIDALEQTILSYPLEPSASDYAKGKLEAYKEFVNLEKFLTQAYQQMKEDATDE